MSNLKLDCKILMIIQTAKNIQKMFLKNNNKWWEGRFTQGPVLPAIKTYCKGAHVPQLLSLSSNY